MLLFIDYALVYRLSDASGSMAMTLENKGNEVSRKNLDSKVSNSKIRGLSHKCKFYTFAS